MTNKQTVTKKATTNTTRKAPTHEELLSKIVELKTAGKITAEEMVRRINELDNDTLIKNYKYKGKDTEKYVRDNAEKLMSIVYNYTVKRSEFLKLFMDREWDKIAMAIKCMEAHEKEAEKKNVKMKYVRGKDNTLFQEYNDKICRILKR